MDEIKVSVIMPAYNMERYISHSIESVLCQDFIDWELLIVDDGSTDNTGQIGMSYAVNDSRIKYFYKENGGLPSARNYAIERASGELLALLDSDDLWLPNKLSISVAEFGKGDQDLLFTSFYKFSSDDQIGNLSDLRKFEVGNCVYENAEAIRAFIKGNKIHVPTVVVKREVMMSVGCFPMLNFAEDYCAWLLLLLNKYKLRSINDALSFYRVTEQSMYHSAKRIYFSLFKVFEFLIIRYPEILEFKKELIVFFKYYIAIDYDRTKKEELKYIMRVFKINNWLFSVILLFDRLLPGRFESKLLRMSL